MSSQALARAKANRGGERAPPVSGNRPVTSIGSQAAFAQQMPPGMGYNMPPPPNNVRVARSMQPPPQNNPRHQPPPNQYYEQQQRQQQYNGQTNPQTNGLPFQKLSISDAVGLITLRLGRVEQWMYETDHENELKEHSSNGGIPDNHKVIDNSVLTSIINRLDSLEKNGTGNVSTDSGSLAEINKLSDDVKNLSEQFKRIGDTVTKHTLELAKNTEQVFRFNRELTETKDILKSFMVKYDAFTHDTTQSFADYELALADIEKRLPVSEESAEVEQAEGVSVDTNATDGENIIMTVDLKNMIKQELANS